jgi:hypothetical protein
VAIDPKVWEQIERERGPLPRDGDCIRVTTKDDRSLEGVVELVWLAMDEPCVELQTAQGKAHFFPGHGATWTYA